MSRGVAFVLLLLTIALGLLNILLIEGVKVPRTAPPLVQSDFPACVTIHNGPIQRPDHYTTRPWNRKRDEA